MQRTAAVSLERVSFSYDGQQVLQDASLEIAPGEFVGIVGPNGGGKTTLLKLMLGLLAPSEGSVRLFGEPPRKARGSHAGYVPQNFSSDPSFPVTVGDVVLMGRLGRSRPFGPFGARDREAAQGALGSVGLAGFGGRPFRALSGGERQRVLIARALATGPDILMLDEPTANVDAVAERELNELLEGLNRTMTVVLVTHNLQVVSRYVKRVVCVNRRVMEHPTCEIPGELRDTFGGHMRLVRHDIPGGQGGPACPIS